MQITIETNDDDNSMESAIQAARTRLRSATTDKELLHGLAETIAGTGRPAPTFVSTLGYCSCNITQLFRAEINTTFTIVSPSPSLSLSPSI